MDVSDGPASKKLPNQDTGAICDSNLTYPHHFPKAKVLLMRIVVLVQVGKL